MRAALCARVSTHDRRTLVVQLDVMIAYIVDFQASFISHFQSKTWKKMTMPSGPELF
jgi:hypothetical protein